MTILTYNRQTSATRWLPYAALSFAGAGAASLIHALWIEQSRQGAPLIFVPYLACVGFILAVAALRARRNRHPRGLLILSVAVAIAVVDVLVWMPIRVQLRQHVEAGALFECQKQMRAVYQGIHLYASNHNGAFPTSLQQLVDDDDVGPYDIGCTEQRILLATTRPGAELRLRQQYDYNAAAMTASDKHSAVLLYEPLDNHGSGINVTFADGRVELIDRKRAEELLSSMSGKEGDTQH